jgi:hypothetical protein
MLVTLLVVTFVMGVFSMGAGAAFFSDTDADAPTRLAALDVLNGYPDGTFKPDNAITRAEFAAVAVRSMGLENAAQFAAGPTEFSDVPANHWASGYINVAVDQEIINGYPDGTFKPNQNVTYAEALAMVVRVLGYDHDLVGAWPTKYLVKGAELKLDKGLGSFNANAFATRGDVAKMADNALTVALMVQIGYGDDKQWVVSGTAGTDKETLLGDRLDCVNYEDAEVLDLGLLVGSSVDFDEIKVQADKAYTFTLLDVDYDLLSYVGHEVDLWVNDDDEVVFITDNDADDVVEATGDVEVTTSDDKFEYDGKTYTIDGNTFIVYNFEVVDYPTWDLDDADTNAAGTKYTGDWFFIADKKTVTWMFVIDWPTPVVVEDVDVDDLVIEDKLGSDIDLDEDDDYLMVALDGSEFALADLEENDLVYSFNNDTILVVVRDVVEGEFNRQRSEYADVYIDGVKYDVYMDDPTEAYWSTDGGDDFDQSSYNKLLGEDVVAYLDAQGKVFLMYGVSDKEDDSMYAVIVNDAKVETSGYAEEYLIKLLTEKGDVVVYNIDEDYYDDELAASGGNWADFAGANNDNVTEKRGTLITFELNSAGEIDEMALVTVKEVTLKMADDGDDIDDYGRFKDSGYKYAHDDIVVFDISSADVDDWDVVGWNALADATGTVDVKAEYDGRWIMALLLVTGTFGSTEADEVLFVEQYQTKDDWHLVYFTPDGKEVDVIASKKMAGLNQYDVVELSFNAAGEVTRATPLTFVAGGPFQLGPDPVDGNLLTVNGVEYLVDKDTVIFDTEDDDLDILSLKNLRKGDWVMIIHDDEVLEYVIRVDK